MVNRGGAMSNPTLNSIESVTHTYHDHANEDVTPHLLQKLILESSVARSGADHPFPIKLHYVLGKVVEDGLSHVVSWQPHGRCFLVHDQKEFVDRILKCWFRQSKFASFQRQLNLYGFRRLTTGRDKGGYYHEFFLRSRPLMAHRIVRTKVKGTGTRKPSSPETEPNFYLMGYLPKEANSKQQMLPVNPTAAQLTLQSLLLTTADGESQTASQEPQAPLLAQALQHTAHQVVPQAHHPPTQINPHQGSLFGGANITLPALEPPSSAPSGSGKVESALPLPCLDPLMSYWIPPVNSAGSRTSVLSNQNNALSNYEAILNMRALSNNNNTGESQQVS